MLEDVDLFARHWVVHERAGGFPRLRVISFETGEAHPVEFPEPSYSVYGTGNAEFDTDTLPLCLRVAGYARFGVRLRPEHREAQAAQAGGGAGRLRSRALPLGADLCRGAGRHADSGVAGLSKGPAPGRAAADAALIGYGAYGFPSDVHFSSTRLSLLDRGVIFAIAHVRGGGEMGKQWHDQGRMLNKKNTFTDFIAAPNT